MKQDETSEADMLEPSPNLRQTRSGSAGFTRSGPSPPRGRGMRSRGNVNRSPIVWNQDGKFPIHVNTPRFSNC